MSIEHKIAISVQDGDFTAWVIHGGHAYPFDNAADAAAAAYADVIEEYLAADAAFLGEAVDEDVWWDTDDATLAELIEQIKQATND